MVGTFSANCTTSQQAFGMGAYHASVSPAGGKRYRILKARRISGVEVLSLQSSCGRLLSVPLDWTDLGSALPFGELGIEPPVLDAWHLSKLADLLERIDGGLTKEG